MLSSSLKEGGKGNGLIYFYLLFVSLTCKTKRPAQARVAMITNMEPLNQSLSLLPEEPSVPLDLLGLMCLDHTISTMGPLYKVISIAPATVTMVPSIFAWHLIFFTFRCSILELHQIKITLAKLIHEGKV